MANSCSDLDDLADFETLSRTNLASNAPTRYAVRQVLDQELQKVTAAREEAARRARFQAGGGPDEANDAAAPRAPALPNGKENKGKTAEEEEPAVKVKRDFFGRIIPENSAQAQRERNRAGGKPKVKVWIKYHEGFNNAVRRPITVKDFMKIL